MKKILLFVLLSFNLIASDGTLDTLFGTAGVVTTPGSGTFSALVVCTVQTDGKIMAVGFIDTNTHSRIIRYNSNGSIDTSFAPPLNYIDSTAPELYTDLLVQPDGKILVGGGNGTTAVLRRYNSDGSVDVTFGTNGLATGPFTLISNFKLQTDSKIVAASFQAAGDSWSVVRYNPNGTLDTIFTDISQTILPNISDIAIQADGKIIASGSRTAPNNPIVVRYNIDGTIDTSFGVNGIFLGSFNQNGAGVAIADDGKIIVGGQNTITTMYSIFRLNTDGTLDTSFGTGGVTTGPSGGASSRNVILQPDGKPLISNGTAAFRLARYTQDGILDTANFNPNNGFTTTPSGFGRAATPQSNGYTIVVGRTSSPPTTTSFQIARYINSPAFAPVTITFPTSGSAINPGEITITGTAENLSFVYVFLDDVLLGGTATNSSNAWSFTTTISDTNSHTLRAVAIYMNHDLNMASDTITFSASSGINFNGRFACNKFLNKTERIIFASWQANPTAVLYKIYKKDKVICTIKPNGSSTLSSAICLKKCDQISDFSISFVTSNDTESSRSVLTLS